MPTGIHRAAFDGDLDRMAVMFCQFDADSDAAAREQLWVTAMRGKKPVKTLEWLMTWAWHMLTQNLLRKMFKHHRVLSDERCLILAKVAGVCSIRAQLELGEAEWGAVVATSNPTLFDAFVNAIEYRYTLDDGVTTRILAAIKGGYCRSMGMYQHFKKRYRSWLTLRGNHALLRGFLSHADAEMTKYAVEETGKNIMLVVNSTKSFAWRMHMVNMLQPYYDFSDWGPIPCLGGGKGAGAGHMKVKEEPVEVKEEPAKVKEEPEA